MIRIKLNSFFILFLFGSAYSGYLEQSVIIFCSVLLHEIGHAAAAKLFKIKVEEIELFPFGGIAKMEDISKYGGNVEAFIAASGPVVTAVIAAAGFSLASCGEIFRKVGLFNSILLSFNMLPALPLDGGRIMRNILVRYMSYKQATKVMAITGRLTAISLVIYNIVVLYEGSTSLAYIITGLFIYIGCEKELHFSSYYYLLNKNNYKKNITVKKRLRPRILKLSFDTYARVAADEFSPGSICIVYVTDDRGRVINILSEADIMNAFLQYGYDCKIGQIK